MDVCLGCMSICTDVIFKQNALLFASVNERNEWRQEASRSHRGKFGLKGYYYVSIMWFHTHSYYPIVNWVICIWIYDDLSRQWMGLREILVEEGHYTLPISRYFWRCRNRGGFRERNCLLRFMVSVINNDARFTAGVSLSSGAFVRDTRFSTKNDSSRVCHRHFFVLLSFIYSILSSIRLGERDNVNLDGRVLNLAAMLLLALP